MRRRNGVAVPRTRRLHRLTRASFAALPHALTTAAASAASPSQPFIAYGGQALVDGVLMRGPSHIGVALRTPEGEIATAHEPLPSSELRAKAIALPLARGILVLWETLTIGARWLMRSADVAAGDEEPATVSSRIAIAGMLFATLLVAIIGFNVVPAVIAGILTGLVGGTPLLVERALDGVLQVCVLLGYLALVGRSGDIDRTYRYHGAEHRAIHTLENEQPLTRQNLARYPTAHPRCGTEFLVVVILVSIVFFSLVGRLDMIGTIISRIIGIPLVAGIAYEVLRLLGRYRTNIVARALAAPGIAVQRITTRKPDDAMHDVAIVALTVALHANGAAAPAGSERPTSRSLGSL